MARQRGGAAPRRASVSAAPPRPAQSRSASTAAYTPAAARPAPPTAQQQAAPQTSQGPNLIGQMASTAAGVAIGSSVGHMIGNMFTGGSSNPVEAAPTAAVDPYQANAQQSSWGAQEQPCLGSIQKFKGCMDLNNNDLNICNWYLDQLKACQAAQQ